MEITAKENTGVLTVRLLGELDHHGAARARQEIDAIIEETAPRKVVLDLGDVYFCDSSGLGLIMGRYKKARSLGAELVIGEASGAVERIMALAGLGAIIKIEGGTTA